jgi:hypothetical protein
MARILERKIIGPRAQVLHPPLQKKMESQQMMELPLAMREGKEG